MCVSVLLYVSQVFGVNEEEAVCAARLVGTERRQRIITQRSGTGDTGKPAHMETEVQALLTYSHYIS